MIPALLCLFIVGCAVNDPIARRMQKPKDREFHVHEYGISMSKEHRNAYLDGRIIPGMKRAYVFDLMGEPDEQIVEVGEVWYKNRPYPLRETLWVYFQEKDTILTVRMRDSVVVEAHK